MIPSSVRIAAAVTAGLIVSVAAAHAAAAAPSEKERDARAHFQAGETRFKAGDFEAALTEYQAGYDAKPLPGFLVNIAQCQRRLGDLKAARASYQKFVLVAPDSPLVPQVKSMMAEIDGLLTATENSKPASGSEPEEPEAKPEPPGPPPPAPKSEREARAAVLVGPAPAAEDTPVAAAPERKSHRWWLWGVIGAVVVGGAVTAYALTAGGTTTIHDGSLATLRR